MFLLLLSRYRRNDFYLIRNCLNTDFQNHTFFISSPVLAILSHPSLTINASIFFDISWTFWPDSSSSLHPRAPFSLHVILPPSWYTRASLVCTSPSSTPRPSPVSITHILEGKPHELTSLLQTRPSFIHSIPSNSYLLYSFGVDLKVKGVS